MSRVVAREPAVFLQAAARACQIEAGPGGADTYVTLKKPPAKEAAAGAAGGAGGAVGAGAAAAGAAAAGAWRGLPGRRAALRGSHRLYCPCLLAAPATRAPELLRRAAAPAGAEAPAAAAAAAAAEGAEGDSPREGPPLKKQRAEAEAAAAAAAAKTPARPPRPARKAVPASFADVVDALLDLVAGYRGVPRPAAAAPAAAGEQGQGQGQAAMELDSAAGASSPAQPQQPAQPAQPQQQQQPAELLEALQSAKSVADMFSAIMAVPRELIHQSFALKMLTDFCLTFNATIGLLLKRDGAHRLGLALRCAAPRADWEIYAEHCTPPARCGWRGGSQQLTRGWPRCRRRLPAPRAAAAAGAHAGHGPQGLRARPHARHPPQVPPVGRAAPDAHAGGSGSGASSGGARRRRHHPPHHAPPAGALRPGRGLPGAAPPTAAAASPTSAGMAARCPPPAPPHASPRLASRAASQVDTDTAAVALDEGASRLLQAICIRSAEGRRRVIAEVVATLTAANAASAAGSGQGAAAEALALALAEPPGSKRPDVAYRPAPGAPPPLKVRRGARTACGTGAAALPAGSARPPAAPSLPPAHHHRHARPRCPQVRALVELVGSLVTAQQASLTGADGRGAAAPPAGGLSSETVRAMREAGMVKALALALRQVDLAHPGAAKAINAVLKPLEVRRAAGLGWAGLGWAGVWCGAAAGLGWAWAWAGLDLGWAWAGPGLGCRLGGGVVVVQAGAPLQLWGPRQLPHEPRRCSG
jgi:hypothetical protein